jgi:5-methylcytosine-specific restriction endonuclease McrA
MTRLRDLPTLAEMQAQRRAQPKHALLTRKAVKAKKQRAARKVVKAVRAEVVTRARGLCERCGKPGQEAHHKIHRSRGGAWTPENITLLCRACHGKAHGVNR